MFRRVECVDTRHTHYQSGFIARPRAQTELPNVVTLRPRGRQTLGNTRLGQRQG